MTLKSEALKKALMERTKEIHEYFMNGGNLHELEPTLIFTHPVDVEMDAVIRKEMERVPDFPDRQQVIEALQRAYIAGRNSIDDGQVKMIVTKP